MNVYKVPCCCFILLFITACDSQAQIASLNIVQEQTLPIKETTVSRVIVTEKTALASVANSDFRQPLNLSIDDVVVEDKADYDVVVFNADADDNNSALFDGLNRKYPDRRLKLSGELLTDENEYETKDILKSVNGVQINLQGKFD